MEISFLCALCSQELRVPTKSQTCSHVFCNVCIKNWLMRNNNCPLKCGVMHQDDLVILKIEDLKNFDYIPFRCPFWKKGCSKILFKHDRLSHEKECEYKHKKELKLVNQENQKKNQNTRQQTTKIGKQLELIKNPQDNAINCLSEITNTYSSGNRIISQQNVTNDKQVKHNNQLHINKQEANNSQTYDFRTETELQDNEEYICCYIPTLNDSKQLQQQQQPVQITTCNCENKIQELQAQIDFLKETQKRFFELCISSFQSSTAIQIQPFLDLFQCNMKSQNDTQINIVGRSNDYVSPRVAQKLDFQKIQDPQTFNQTLNSYQHQVIQPLTQETQFCRTQGKNKSCHETSQKSCNTTITKSVHAQNQQNILNSPTYSNNLCKSQHGPKQVNINLAQSNQNSINSSLRLNAQQQPLSCSTNSSICHQVNNNGLKNSLASTVVINYNGETINDNNDIFNKEDYQIQEQLLTSTNNFKKQLHTLQQSQSPTSSYMEYINNSQNQAICQQQDFTVLSKSTNSTNQQNPQQQLKLSKTANHSRNLTAIGLSMEQSEINQQQNYKKQQENINRAISPMKQMQKSVDVNQLNGLMQSKCLSKNLGQILRSGSFIQQNQLRKELVVNPKKQQNILQVNNQQQQQKKQLYSKTANPSKCHLLSAQKQQQLTNLQQEELQQTNQSYEQNLNVQKLLKQDNLIEIKESSRQENLQQTSQATLQTQLTEVEEGDDCKVNTKEFCTKQNDKQFKLNFQNSLNIITYRTDDIASEREITSIPNSGKEQLRVAKLKSSTQSCDIIEFNPQLKKEKYKLTPQQEKNVIKKLIINQQGKLNGIYLKSDIGQLNEMKYIVSMKWWRKWTDYIEFLDEGTNLNNYRNTNYEKPGFINNSELVKINSIGKGRLPELKDNLLEHHDYEVVSKEVFQYLKKWYNVDITIVRFLKHDPSDESKLCLELYPEKVKKNKSVANLRTNTQGRFSLSKHQLTQSVGDLDIRQIQSLQTFDDEQIFSERYNFNKKFVYNDNQIIDNRIDKNQCQVF